MIVVKKASLISPPVKSITDSQQALASFLARRHERYKSRRRSNKPHFYSSAEISVSSTSANTSIDSLSHSSVKSICTSCDNLLDQEKSTSNLTKSTRGRQDYHTDDGSSLGDSHRSSSSVDFLNTGCEELAERVITSTKARLKKHRKRRINPLYIPPIRMMKVYGEIPIIRTSTPVPLHKVSKANIISSPPRREAHICVDNVTKDMRNLNLSTKLLENYGASVGPKKLNRRVVYLSEKQSSISKETGVPDVPPTTPSSESFNSGKFVGNDFILCIMSFTFRNCKL